MAANLSILIVDDEPNIRKTLAIALEAEGHRVVAVSNLKDALAEARADFLIWRWLTCAWGRNQEWN